MLHSNTKNASNSTDTNNLSKTLFAFKPRQVLIAEHNRASKMAISALKEEKSSKITSLTPEMQGILHQSILHYLHRNGFSKTLKRFQSEAQIQNDTWKASSVHLEEVYRKYLDACNSDNNLSTSKKPVELANDATTNEETTTKKKKKKGSVENASIAVEDQLKDIDLKTAKSVDNCVEVPKDIVVTETETKPKKKKNKNVSDSLGQTEEGKSNVLEKTVDDTVTGVEIDDSTTKPKDKKNKKKKSQQENLDLSIKESKENEGVEPDVTNKEKKSSKKRKRLSSDENDNNISTEVKISEESKRQKTEALKETKNKDVLVKGEEANGKPEANGGEKSGPQKSMKKQQNGSTEPRTINAFQRVKIDQVEFAHEKLQDNSYWAKDGADVGYGAKAQEVLGQVRGRDFRHEKTKKKRGSYRGGLIDLNSHSIKFNYSDEE